MAQSSDAVESFVRNRVKNHHLTKPKEFRKTLDNWIINQKQQDLELKPSNAKRLCADFQTNYSACLRRGDGEQCFKFDRDIQFRVSITYPTDPELLDTALVDDPSEFRAAFSSYHRLLKDTLRTPKHHHMTELLRRIAYRDEDLHTYGRLKDILGHRCPGLERFRRETLEIGEPEAYKNLYHRCLVDLASRLEFTESLSFEDRGYDWELAPKTDHDAIMEWILGHGESFDKELCTSHTYPYDANDITKALLFRCDTEIIRRSPRPQSQETTAELIITRNLLGIEVAKQIMQKSKMVLEKVSVSCWEDCTSDHLYINAGCVMWMTFFHPLGDRSVAVIHGIHDSDSGANLMPIRIVPSV